MSSAKRPEKNHENRQTVCIALCTARRPKMLGRCLASIARLRLPEDWVLKLVVCENDSEPKCRDQIARFAQDHKIDFRYFQEERMGIPIARNRTLDLALEVGTDWIVFFDDDEEADPYLLVAYREAARHFDADIFTGRVVRIFPSDTPKWFPKNSPGHGLSGDLVSTVPTSNTMMAASIASSDGLALRFDERLRFTGGSDVEFFNRAQKRGKKAVAVPEAIVYETVPPERVTLRWLFSRVERKEAMRTRDHVQENGKTSTAFRIFGDALSMLIVLVAFPFSFAVNALTSIDFARKKAVRVVRKLAKLSGQVRGLFGAMPQPYRQIEGD